MDEELAYKHYLRAIENHKKNNYIKAEKYYIKALQEKIDLNQAIGNLAFLYLEIADWKRARRLMLATKKMSDEAISIGAKAFELPLYNLATSPDLEDNLKVAQSWSEYIEHDAQAKRPLFTHKRDKSRKKIRIGYLSADFRSHPIGHQVKDLFTFHNREIFEIYAYYIGPPATDNVKKKILFNSDHFFNISKMSKVKCAELINKHQIDILVDMMGHSKLNRMEIAALNPAPIQMTWLGYLATTGADYYHYIIADKNVIKKSEEKFYTENIIYMPDTYQVASYKPIKITKKRSSYKIKKSQTVFACFHRPYKINEMTIKVWSAIAKEVPDSIIWLLDCKKHIKKNLEREFIKTGFNPNRLRYTKWLDKEEHLARLALADIALDTFGVGGYVTTADALWAGVPVVTKQGSNFPSRASQSILKAHGMASLITKSFTDYKNKAIKLAKTQKYLEKTKSKIQNNKLTKPLFNTELFAYNLEKAYAMAWLKHVKGEPPKSFKVK